MGVLIPGAAELRRVVRPALLLALAACAAPKGPKFEEPVRPRASIHDAIRDGVAYLERSQNPDGSWGAATDTTGYDVWATVPGAHHAFRVATTALAVMALIEAKGDRDVIRRGVTYLIEAPPPRRGHPMEIYNIWSHAYALQALAAAYRLEEADEVRRAGIRASAERHVEMLGRYETMYGGWNYYDFDVGAQRPSSAPTSFGTAAALVAFYDAQSAGLAVPEGMTRRAERVVAACRKPDGSYIYDFGFRYYPQHLANWDKGSLGRTQSGNVALYLWGGGVSKRDLIDGLDRMIAEHRFMEMGRKRQYPHEAWYFTSGYYYYFGHYYAARIVELLNPEEQRERRLKLAEFVLPHQEADGSWWDYKMYSYHKQYGTAYAVMTLIRCLDVPYQARAK